MRSLGSGSARTHRPAQQPSCESLSAEWARRVFGVHNSTFRLQPVLSLRVRVTHHSRCIWAMDILTISIISWSQYLASGVRTPAAGRREHPPYNTAMRSRHGSEWFGAMGGPEAHSARRTTIECTRKGCKTPPISSDMRAELWCSGELACEVRRM